MNFSEDKYAEEFEYKIFDLNNNWGEKLAAAEKDDMRTAMLLTEEISDLYHEIRKSKCEQRYKEALCDVLFFKSKRFYEKYLEEYKEPVIALELLKQFRIIFENVPGAKDTMDEYEQRVKDELVRKYIEAVAGDGAAEHKTPAAEADFPGRSSDMALIGVMLLFQLCSFVVYHFLFS